MSEAKPPLEGAREGKILSRRQFFSIVGWSSFLTSLGGSAFGAYKFFSPSVLYEPPTVFKIGRPEEFGMGVDVRFMKERQVWVARNERGVYVMIGICRHLGCTPNWLQDVQRFRCPCHGSIYDIYGNVLGGPAPRTLWRAAIAVDPEDKQIIVNTLIRQDPDPHSGPEGGLIVEETGREVEPYFLRV